MVAPSEALQLPLVENLTSGEIRMKAGGCAFLFKRLMPGVIFTAIAGTDKGELGTIALDEITEEFARFRQPLPGLLMPSSHQAWCRKSSSNGQNDCSNINIFSRLSTSLPAIRP